MHHNSQGFGGTASAVSPVASLPLIASRRARGRGVKARREAPAGEFKMSTTESHGHETEQTIYHEVIARTNVDWDVSIEQDPTVKREIVEFTRVIGWLVHYVRIRPQTGDVPGETQWRVEREIDCGNGVTVVEGRIGSFTQACRVAQKEMDRLTSPNR